MDHSEIIKLNASKLIQSGAIVFLDSDFVFLRKFSDADFTATMNGCRVLLRQEPTTETGKLRNFVRSSREILMLPPGSTEHHYVSTPVIWYAEWLQSLIQFISQIHHRPWQLVLADAAVLSEYCLYGVYIEEILKPANLRVCTEPFYWIAWDEDSFRSLVSGQFAPEALSENFRELGVCVQSNLKFPVNSYRRTIEEIWSRTAGIKLV